VVIMEVIDINWVVGCVVCDEVGDSVNEMSVIELVHKKP